MRVVKAAVAAFSVCAAAACGEPGGDVDASAAPDAYEGNADSAPAADAGAPRGYVPDAVGTVTLVMSDFAGPEAGCFAVLRDGPQVPGLELVAQEGACAIWRRLEAGFCESPCSGFCSPEGECVPWPVDRSAGTIAVTGLLGPLSFEPAENGYRTETSIEGDLFEPGAEISVQAPGHEVPGFSLSATAVGPFEEEVDFIAIEDDVDEVITWTPGSHGRFQVALRLGWHGGPFTDLLLCEGADVGSLTIPGSLIAQFPYFEGGLFQVPSSMGRFERDVVATPDGEVELFVGSMRYIGFMHAFPE